MRNRRGNAVVEMALILPLLLVLVFGITEFGRAWMTVNIMHTATREAVRLAVVSPMTGPAITAIEDKCKEICDAAAVNWTAVTVSSVDPITKSVTVTVDVDFTVIPGTILGTFSGTIPLQASTTMRHEGT